jgi:oligopeptide/dipeptide ABC transporter ATP-binding protein
MPSSSAPETLTEADDARRALLEVDDLSTFFATDRGIVHAVDHVSFSLRAGRTLGIVGESGSGKSVLARSIMNLVPSSALRPTGTVHFEGRDLGKLSSREARDIWGNDIAMVFQDPMTSLNPTLRVGRQITESVELHMGLHRRAANARANEFLTHVGIPEANKRARMYPYELSGGMRQRVGIAIALACSPKLLLADEPTTALDVTIERQILDLLSGLQRETGMAMILISHDLGVVAGRTDEIMVMYGGRVIEQGPTKSVFRAMRHPYTAALLASIPRLDQPSHTLLSTIPGRPVDVVDPKPGCRFAPRCPYAQPKCREDDPPIVESAPGHRYACFFPLDPTSGSAIPAASTATPNGASATEPAEVP